MGEERKADDESRQGLLDEEGSVEGEDSAHTTLRGSLEIEDVADQLDKKVPRYQLSKTRLVTLLIGIFMSNFSAAIDTGLSASTHTAVASAFHHTNLASWPVNAFVIASMAIQPLYGRASDILGRKLPYISASTAFAAGIILSAFASRWEFLIMARVICGLGSAGTTTMGSVVLTDAVGLAKRGYYQSINYAVYGGGSALGSAIGGAIVQNYGWDWVYKFQIPTSVAALAVLSFSLPTESTLSVGGGTKRARFGVMLREFDWRGSMSLITTLLSLFVFLTIAGNIYPWTHPSVIAMGIATVASTLIFIHVETRVDKPILPLYLLLRFPARNIMLTGFLTSFINYTILYNTTLFFQTVHLDTVEDAGFRLIIPSISFTIASCTTGFIVARRQSPQFTLMLGQGFILVGTIGLVCMAALFRLVHAPGWLYNSMLVCPIIGVGMLASSTVLALLNVTPTDDQAVANGGLILIRSLGVFISTAFSTTILQNLFLAFVGAAEHDPREREIIEDVRSRAEMLLSVEKPLQAIIVSSYSKAFTAVYGTCALAALLIVCFLRTVRTGKFKDSGS